jgi:hypothetical protein
LRTVKRPLHANLFAGLLWLTPAAAFCQAVLPPDLNELPGERPYEMVWAHRAEPGPATVRCDQLEGWKCTVENGAEAALQITRVQNLWDRAVARLRYRGNGRKEPDPRIRLTPPQPIPLPEQADSVDLWLYGNRWDWENPPDTPPVRVVLHLRDARGELHEIAIDKVRWKEWWLAHKRIPSLEGPVRLEDLEFSGGWQTEWREVYLDSVRFYREDVAPIKFAARPRRNLALPSGQSPGVNTGPGRLPFPTTQKTILPEHFAGAHHNGLVESDNGPLSLDYLGKDCSIAYSFDPAQGLGSLEIWYDHQLLARPLDGALVKLPGGSKSPTLTSLRRQGKTVHAEYSDGTVVGLQIWRKSLVIDLSNATGLARELVFGQLSGVTEPRVIPVPFLTYGGGARPSVLLSRAGTTPVFTSLWLDWYRSNGSEPYAAESAGTNSARINGGVRYHPRTDGQFNPLFERLFLTVSPVFEETLPSIPNPVGLHAHDAADCLWQETWGPDDYTKQMERSRRLRAYGIERLIQCNHEIAWRDGGESFTLRTRAAPKKGGDAALARYVAHQRGLGWLVGLYSNYTDYSPVNEFWSPDGVQRLSDGNWRSAWPRCWAEKPLKAVEFDAMLAPRIKEKFQSTSAYTDVHTAVSPWGYNDYDARVPGAGTFAQTFYAYGELLRNDSRVYGGPIFSEGTYHWLYAGLADGNYALAYDGHPLANEPLLPVFDLCQIHPRECDIGMGWTANFCDAIPDWRKPENLDRAIDRFLLHTLAYGHIGWLVEEEHGLDRMCRSYYMLQQVQKRYGLQKPVRIAYWDGTQLVSVSTALVRDLPRSRRQLFVQYPGGLQLWLNDHPSETWNLPAPLGRSTGAPAREIGFEDRPIRLPPSGWAAFTGDRQLFSFSSLDGTNRVDYVRSPEYVYLDGRGNWFDAPEAGSDGAVAIKRLGKTQLQVTRISGAAPLIIHPPAQLRAPCVRCDAFSLNGALLPEPDWDLDGLRTRIKPRDKAVTYVLTFSERPRP